jgi:spore coat protein SA
MLKAAIIAPNSLPVPPIRGGGIQTVIAETVPLYREFKPYVFSICEWNLDKLPLAETVGNVEHRRVCQSPWEEFKIKLAHLTGKNYFPYVFEIVRQIKEIKPDVIHVMNRPWFLPILRKYLNINSKIVLHHHNRCFAGMPRNAVEGYLSLFDAFAGISDHTVKEEMLDRFPLEAARCFTIYNGINLDKFKPRWINPEAAARVRARYKIGFDDTVLLFAGRLRKDKGAHTLLKAANKVIATNKKVKVLIVGSHFYAASEKMTGYISQLYKLAEPIKDNVIFTGFIPPAEMPGIYSASDVLVVPSHEDAFGLVYAEAAASGIPAIGTRIGGIPEVIDEQLTGFLMQDPENTDELVSLLRVFTDNPARSRPFGERGRKKAESMFSIGSTVRKTEEMYNRVLELPERS